MPSVERNGYSFEYLEQGTGEPLVFVHGSASDYRTWKSQQTLFSTNFHTISYSRRYHWPNLPIGPTADYAMAEHVDDLSAIIDELRLAPANLVSHSYGALVALQLTIQQPGMVQKLVLSEPPAIRLYVSNKPKPHELLKLAVKHPRTALAIVNLGARGLGPAAAAAERGDMDEAMRLFGTAALGKSSYQQLSDSRKDVVRANLIRAEFLGSGFPPLHHDQVRQIDKPIVLVNGENSPPAFHYLSDRLQELLPAAEKLVIPNASHIVHEDNPNTYYAAVSDFLTN